jgi:hypothetical protein
VNIPVLIIKIKRKVGNALPPLLPHTLPPEDSVISYGKKYQ